MKNNNPDRNQENSFGSNDDANTSDETNQPEEDPAPPHKPSGKKPSKAKVLFGKLGKFIGLRKFRQPKHSLKISNRKLSEVIFYLGCMFEDGCFESKDDKKIYKDKTIAEILYLAFGLENTHIRQLLSSYNQHNHKQKFLYDDDEKEENSTN